VRVRGRAWKVYDKPEGDFREFSGWRPFTANGYDSARTSADALARHWPRMGGAPPRDSEAARRTPLPADEEKHTDSGAHNRTMRRSARNRQQAQAPRRRTRRAA
jgi:hypothetical protein